MPLNFDNLKGNVSEFNQKYGVNFDFNSLRTRAAGMGTVMLSEESSNDIAYKLEFKKVLQTAISNVVYGKNDVAISHEILKDYEKMIMEPYRNECQKNGIVAPKPYGGMNEKEGLEMMAHIISNAPKSLSGQEAMRYQNGDIRIRDMVADAKSIADSKVVSEQQLKQLAAYSDALTSVNNSRSAVWKFFHPFRNRAEQREAKAIKAVFQSCADRFFGEVNNKTDRIGMVQKDATNPNEGVLKDLEKINVAVRNYGKKMPAAEDKPMEAKDFLKIGYRPNINNIEKEYEIISKLYKDDMKKPDFLSHDPENKDAAIKIISENYLRCQLIYLSHADGSREKTESLFSKMHGVYEESDASLQKRYSNYKAPESLEPNDKEAISVNIEEKIVDKSAIVKTTNEKTLEKVMD